MINKLAIIIDLSDGGSFKFYKNFFYSLINKLEQINLIDISKIIKNKNIEDFGQLNKNFILHNPQNISELKILLKENNFILMYCIHNGLKYFSINYLISKLKIKKFIVSNLGYNPENFNYFNKNLFEKIQIFFKIRFSYYFFRILVLLNILPKIDFFFEASSFIMKSIENGWSKKIQNIIPWINLSYYKKIIKINSRYYDDLKDNDNSEDYIVFIDGFIFDHQDVTMREGDPDSKIRSKYYHHLSIILSNLEKIYKKQVIICLHPKNNNYLENNDFGSLQCVKYQTEEYIKKAFIVLFHESSSIVQAILLKKNIISLQGKILGSYVNQRCKIYSDMLKLKEFSLDFEPSSIIDGNKLLIELNNSKINYEEYIQNNIIAEKNLSGAEQIINYFRDNKLI